VRPASAGADPRQSQTKSNRIQRFLVQLTRPSRTVPKRTTAIPTDSVITRLIRPQVPGLWPLSHWYNSTERWTFRGLTCPPFNRGLTRPPSPALGFDQAYNWRSSFLQLMHQPSSRATRIKPSSSQQALQLFNPVSRTTSSFLAYLAAIGQIASAIPDSNAYRRGSDKLIR
jgi:hypothetical protein